MADDTSRTADFVRHLVSDAKNPPETRLLSGWFGDAADDGYRRLYTDAELGSYIDIPDDAILYVEPIRDVQPSGGVYVWVRRDAALKPGGSASSRAARFLQGSVQQELAGGGGGGQDSGSLEGLGFRCVTQIPCGEPTGFTGRCTQQPVVGGAWPCITAIPHCSEPTGFTGQCTYQPWPNPTRYVGCTILHCPTKDLTHVQHICNVVATGLPGCPVVDPRGGGIDPVAKAESAGAGGGQEAAAPVTSLPGCGYTKTWGACETHLLGCGTTQVPKCTVSVDIPCITRTEMPNCQTVRGGFAGAEAAAAPRAATTEFIQCNPSAVDACPTRIRCETQLPTTFCTQFSEACPTDLRFCPETSCGPRCQTQQAGCTQVGCPSQFGSGCPTDTATDCTFGCTLAGTGCPVSDFVACTSLASCNPNDVARAEFRPAGPGPVIGPTGYHGCTVFAPNCPHPTIWTQIGPRCRTLPSGDCTFFGCGQFTQNIRCGGGPSAVDACPTRLCGGR